EITGKAVDRYFELNAALFEFHELFHEENPNERAIALVAATFLETLLDHILLAFLPEDEKEVNQLLNYNQPLGTFSGKITMVYCLGLMEKKVKKDLDLIRKIRNKFAHQLRVDFEDGQIRSWCNELSWYKIALGNSPEGASNKMIFQVAVDQLITHLNGCVSIARGEKRKVVNNF
ncbi:MltR family transcriptional regulator, partial [Pseudomonas sp. AMR01]|uniref:MltR family transcriptional regulator n=1 Tax=Pseudomonas sp. AMR01 TaxID=3064904 RepID=UPI0035C1783F